MKRCLFCEKSNVKFGPEHLLGAWLWREMVRRGIRVTHKEDRDETGKRPNWKGRAASLNFITTDVCRECNTGWMNATFENRVAPILGPVIFDGEPIGITPETATLIATWATKVALLAPTARKENPKPSRERCQRLFIERTPAPDARIWLGAYAGYAPGSFLTFGAYPFFPNGKPPQRLGFWSSVLVGHLIVQYIEGMDALLIPATLGEPSPLDMALIQIWPLRTQPYLSAWPPPITCQSFEEFENLRRQFSLREFVQSRQQGAQPDQEPPPAVEGIVP